jgi:hypothetical protein
MVDPGSYVSQRLLGVAAHGSLISRSSAAEGGQRWVPRAERAPGRDPGRKHDRGHAAYLRANLCRQGSGEDAARRADRWGRG